MRFTNRYLILTALLLSVLAMQTAPAQTTRSKQPPPAQQEASAEERNIFSIFKRKDANRQEPPKAAPAEASKDRKALGTLHKEAKSEVRATKKERKAAERREEAARARAEAIKAEKRAVKREDKADKADQKAVKARSKTGGGRY